MSTLPAVIGDNEFWLLAKQCAALGYVATSTDTVFSLEAQLTGLVGSGAGTGGIPEAPTDGQLYGRTNAAWSAVPPQPSVNSASRYIRQRHCDSPVSTSDPNPGAGGAAIGSGVAPSLVGTGHIGVWTLGTGVSNGSYQTLISSAIGPEFNITNAVKLGFRAVMKTLAVIPSGAVGSATYGEINLGWVNALHVLPLATQNLVIWRFAPGSNWALNTADGTTLNSVVSNVPVTPNTWYDVRIYWDATGVIGKIGIYGQTLYSTGLITANDPAPGTAMFWQIMNILGAAGTTNFTTYLALYEIIAESTGTQFLGDQLVTNF